MTANGWLQIIVYLAVILALTKPMGVFMTRVFNREQTFLDPVLRPIERLLYRLTLVDEEHEMRWTEYAVLHAAVQRRFHAGAVSDPTHPADPALESAEIRRGRRPILPSTQPPRSRRTPTGRTTAAKPP